ncbi:hypothetical protein Hoch_1239 [Haliangium ochraceum DSM 14365]|uniref:Immunity MXAN-0049 protein domain-containing protein n=2 Tax=Haliangium ochraceum TaxID=80816 RepID=D0LTA6_HALO1|nr:hypothetical protein Hoch_1239 [Haliangium ochraceum DSM 14365]
MTQQPHAFILFWDMDHLKDSGRDAMMTPFEGSERVAGWVHPRPLDLPAPIEFEANFPVIARSDYPSNNAGWPLMSPRMLAVLGQLGDIPHRRIPVRMLDRMAFADKRYMPDGSLRPEAVDERFVAVQLSEHIDAVDWEHSKCEMSTIDSSRVSYFERLVLAPPDAGLPPLFRLRAKPSHLLVSARARHALEDAGIRGVSFQSLPGAETT